jgi:hypothetical protein
VWDRWDLWLPDKASRPARTAALLAKRVRPLRLVGDVLVPGCSFAARKPTVPPL